MSGKEGRHSSPIAIGGRGGVGNESDGSRAESSVAGCKSQSTNRAYQPVRDPDSAPTGLGIKTHAYPALRPKPGLRAGLSCGRPASGTGSAAVRRWRVKPGLFHSLEPQVPRLAPSPLRSLALARDDKL